MQAGAARRISERFAEAAELCGSPPSAREFVDVVGFVDVVDVVEVVVVHLVDVVLLVPVSCCFDIVGVVGGRGVAVGVVVALT